MSNSYKLSIEIIHLYNQDYYLSAPFAFEPRSDIVKPKQHVIRSIWKALFLLYSSMCIVPPTLSFISTAHHVINNSTKQPPFPPKFLKIDQVGFKFKICFGIHDLFLKTIVKIRKQSKANKVYRISYPDGNEEDIYT